MASTFFRRRFLNKFGQPCTYYKRSSIWPGFRPLFQDILDGSQWIIGSDTTLDLWHHNWLGSSVIERLNIPVSVANTLQLKLLNFINNGCWVCPINLQSLCAPFWEDIIKITLPFKDGFVDRLVWKSAKDGKLTVALAYDLKRPHLPRVPWARFVWHSCFRARNSVVLWKYMHGKLLTDDIRQLRGCHLSSVCSLCHNNVETAEHLFLHCSFATNIWGNLLDLFQVRGVFNDIISFFTYPVRHGYSSQLTLLWWGMIGACFYAIWHARNALRFQELIILPGSLLHSIKMQLHEINFLSKDTMKNTVGELCILHRIGIKGRPSKAPKIVEVMWHVPSNYQVKFNTDGAARGSPGLAGFGGIFQDHLGQVLGCFSGNLGIATALEAELQAVIHAIQMAS
ncbi:hypothetical protein ACLB2K_011895 [Fragaria x ananassa]